MVSTVSLEQFGDPPHPGPMAADGTDGSSVWGDETAVADAVLAWATQRVARPSDPRTTARPAPDLARDAGPTITPAGIGGEEALRVFADVLAPATRAQDDPLNLAYIPAAPTRAAVAFDAATSAANIFAGTWETGAGAIHAENEALGWLLDLTGWPRQPDGGEAAGVFVAGGTMGNLSALHAARWAAQQRRLAAGLPARPPGGWWLACTASAHSSVRIAARVLDVDVLLVPAAPDGRLTGDHLRASLATLPRGADAESVFAVVASAGSTNEGIVDDLASVAAVCAEQRAAGQHGFWLHVDGAYGGAALCAPSVRHRFAGIERADSLIVDPHKWLFAPYDCAALLYREPWLAKAVHTQDASYLDAIHHHDGSYEWNPTDYAYHLTRRARGLALWFSLVVNGTQAYTDAIESTIALTHQVADDIRAADHLELLREPSLGVVLFRRTGWTSADYDAWGERLLREQKAFVTSSSWEGEVVGRFAFLHPGTTLEMVREVLAETA